MSWKNVTELTGLMGKTGSIAARLTFWYALLSIVLIVSTGSALYWVLADRLRQEDDQLLAGRIAEMRAILKLHSTNSAVFQEEIQREATMLPGIYLRLLDARGIIIVETPATRAAFSGRKFISPSNTENERGTDWLLHGEMYRVMSGKITIGSGFTVQVAMNRYLRRPLRELAPVVAAELAQAPVAVTRCGVLHRGSSPGAQLAPYRVQAQRAQVADRAAAHHRLERVLQCATAHMQQLAQIRHGRQGLRVGGHRVTGRAHQPAAAFEAQAFMRVGLRRGQHREQRFQHRVLRKTPRLRVVVAALAGAGIAEQQRQAAHQLRAVSRCAGEPGRAIKRAVVERLAQRMRDRLQAAARRDDAEDVVVVRCQQLERFGAAADHHPAFADLVPFDARAVVRERDAAPHRVRADAAGLPHRVAGAFAEHLHVIEPHIGQRTAKGTARELVVTLLPTAQAGGMGFHVVGLRPTHRPCGSRPIRNSRGHG